MSAGAAIYHAQRDRVLLLKFIGTIRIASREASRLGAALDSYIRRLPEIKDFDQVLIDLREASTIDSTHLGLLAQIAQFSLTRWNRRATILSTNDDINAILDSVGFDQVFLIVRSVSAPTADLESLQPAEPGPGDEAHMVLQAHRALAKLNPSNEEQFRTVIELLDDELRQRGKPH